MKCKLCDVEMKSFEPEGTLGICPDCWKVVDCQCGLEKL